LKVFGLNITLRSAAVLADRWLGVFPLLWWYQPWDHHMTTGQHRPGLGVRAKKNGKTLGEGLA
jgi:hypothetical protein